jgi:hypothetical protein
MKTLPMPGSTASVIGQVESIVSFVADTTCVCVGQSIPVPSELPPLALPLVLPPLLPLALPLLAPGGPLLLLHAPSAIARPPVYEQRHHRSEDFMAIFSPIDETRFPEARGQIPSEPPLSVP